MRKAVIPFVLSVGLITVWAVPADAASTRAEYAAQADPICKSSDKQTGRLSKRFVGLAKQYPFKIQAAANALEGISRTISSTNSSLRLIPPPPGDEALIPQWLDIWDRIAAKYRLGASAYRLNEFKKLNHLLSTAIRLNRRARALVSDWPFQHCA
jgi:hypothetical protein